MANYWDTYNPGLLAGEDYWEDFTPEAPTQTGVVGAVTGRRYEPWEKGYHKIAGLVDDSGDYDAWYDPDPPPETSRPDWGTPEGYENWANRIALATGSGSDSGTGSSGVEGPTWSGNYKDGKPVDQHGNVIDPGQKVDFSKVTNFLASGNVVNGLLGLAVGGPLTGIVGAYGSQIKDVISDILDSSSGWWGGADDTEVAPATDTGQGDPTGGTVG